VRKDFPARFTALEYSSEAHRALPCGGRLLLALEPLASVPDLDGMLDAIASGSAVARTLDLARGTVRWERAGNELRGVLDGDLLRVVYEPAWRLIVAGGGELAQWVCRFAQLLDYAVSACDPRPEYNSGWPLAEVPLAAVYPDDFIDPARCDSRTAVVALTHDPKIDDLAVLQALRSRAFYIGALGSRRTTASRAARLREHFQLDDTTVARIRGPIGIDLNTRKPAEIALAVLAEITAARNGVKVTTARAHA
jgi:xanthine dehydrogenase accessory factor